MEDLFNMFSAPPELRRKPRKASKNALRGDFARLRGIVVRLYPASLLFFADDAQKEVFLPLVMIADWHFPDGTKRGLRLTDLHLDDEVTIVTYKWLAKKEGLL